MREAIDRLLELGLSQKEARIYVALLELGPSSVQDLARKSEVNRSSAYQLLENLISRGLISRVTRERGEYFMAESPQRLRQMTEEHVRRASEHHERLEGAMPYFFALFNAMEEKPVVRFFEGEEGIVAAREALMHHEGEFLSFTAIDEGTHQISKIDSHQRQRMSRNVSGRVIVAIKPGFSLPESDGRLWENREIPYESVPFSGEVNLVGDLLAAFTVKTRPLAFIVQSKELTELFRALFFTAWATAKPFNVEKV
jgi:HTH-type transcriptional regulator, sugar sensing transcriptional regulator